MIDDIATQLRKTAEYAINPAFKEELRKRMLAQFLQAQIRAHVVGVLIANPCAYCKREREEKLWS